MNKTITAAYLLISVVVLFMVAISSAIIFIAATEDSEAASITESEVPQEQLSDGAGTVSLKEEQPVEQEIPWEYKEYIENSGMANKFLEDNPKFANIIKSIDEEGINIVANDVSFHIEFNGQGLIEEIAIETDDEYKTIVIHSKLSDFLGKAQNAENLNQLLDIVSDMDIPFRYYIKIPEIVGLI